MYSPMKAEQQQCHPTNTRSPCYPANSRTLKTGREVGGMPGRGRAAREVLEKRKTREKVNVFRNLTSPLGGADRGGWEADGAREERDGNRRKRGKKGSLEC